MYRDATDICVLILYILTLLNSFFSSNTFWWSLQGFLYIIPWHLQIETVSLLPSWFGCLLFLLLAYWLWQGLPVLCSIKVWDSGHPCLVLDLRGKSSGFHCWVLCYMSGGQNKRILVDTHTADTFAHTLHSYLFLCPYLLNMGFCLCRGRP